VPGIDHRLADVHPIGIDRGQAHPGVVSGAARLDDRDRTPDFTVTLEVAERDCHVGEAGDLARDRRGELGREMPGRRGRQQCRDLMLAEDCGERNGEVKQRPWRCDALKRGQSVDDNPFRCEFFDCVPDPDEVIFNGGHLRVVAHHLEQPGCLHGIDVDAPARGVAPHLLTGLIEGESEAALAALDTASMLCGTAAIREHGDDWTTRQPVMTPDMIRQLPATRALVIRGGHSPVIGKLRMAWHDPIYRRARHLHQATATLDPATGPEQGPWPPTYSGREPDSGQPAGLGVGSGPDGWYPWEQGGRTWDDQGYWDEEPGPAA
jgi:hypothetical protein